MPIGMLILMLCLLSHDELMRELVDRGHRPTLLQNGAEGWRLWVLVSLPWAGYALTVGMTWIGCRFAGRKLDRKPAHGAAAVGRVDRLLTVGRWTVVLIFIGQMFHLGWLLWLRSVMGEWILLNDLIALSGPVLAMMGMWAAYHPIDRRLREATILSRLDQGLPIPHIWTRPQYVLAQLRHHVLLLAAPMLMILTWLQILQKIAHSQTEAGRFVVEWHQGLVFLGGLGVFLLAPLAIRRLWDTVELPAGELRDRMSELCRMHGVKVRKLLLWRTYGGMINAAVMGLLAPLRYILLSDALIENMTGPQVEAVMAHELGHVKRRHIPWMMVCAMTSFMLTGLAADLLLGLAPEAWRPENSMVAGSVGLGVAVGGWIALFGWISRRFERQADTFAVQHLSMRYPDEMLGAGVISPAAVGVMIDALRQVGHLNHINPVRPSWRHGSLQWRMEYLAGLIGLRADRLPVDRQLRWICMLAAGALGLMFLLVQLNQISGPIL